MNKEINIQKIIDYVSSNWHLGPIHGIGHWRRVERNGLLIATDKVNINIVRLFAYLHDHKRIEDGYDLEHGLRAAENLDNLRESLLSELTENEFSMLKTACKEHSITNSTGIPTIDACFDADRLDLPRVGYKPDPSRMASPLGALYAIHDIVNDDCSISIEKAESLKAEFISANK